MIETESHETGNENFQISKTGNATREADFQVTDDSSQNHGALKEDIKSQKNNIRKGRQLSLEELENEIKSFGDEMAAKREGDICILCFNPNGLKGKLRDQLQYAIDSDIDV